jgi:hypothetical protein
MEELTDKEREAVLKLNAEYRRAYFEDKAKKNGCFYILADNDGPVLLQESEAEGSVIPAFSDEQFARMFAEKMKLEGAEPKQVTAQAYNSAWVPMLKDNGMELGFMPLGGEDFETGVPESL